MVAPEMEHERWVLRTKETEKRGKRLEYMYSKLNQ